MKLCIIITAHKDFDLLAKIINKLNHKDVDIYLNIDLKSNIDKSMFPNVNFIKKRYDIKWGNTSQIDSTINCLEETLLSKENYDYFISISGQDYPIKRIDEIVKFFKDNKDKQYINYGKIGKDYWDIESRYKYYHFNNKIITKLFKIFKQRKFINNYVPYGGASWFNINRKAAEYIVTTYKKYNFSTYFKYSSCIDEIVIQSILCNSEFLNTLVNDSKRYVSWTDHKKNLNKGNPDILTHKDYQKIINSNAFFARKIDSKASAKLIAMIDEHLS